MWLFWNQGFMSVVEALPSPVPRGVAPPPKSLVVRFRCRDDGERFARSLEIHARIERKVTATPKADYPFRVFVPKEAFATWLTWYATKGINYTNFKNAVADTLPNERSHRINALHRIWAIMRNALDPRALRAGDDGVA